VFEFLDLLPLSILAQLEITLAEIRDRHTTTRREDFDADVVGLGPERRGPLGIPA
jgi:hypothetical protein